MSETHFTCAVCGGTFEKDWSDEEALAELGDHFAGFTPDECGLVCDDCYRNALRGIGHPAAPKEPTA